MCCLSVRGGSVLGVRARCLTEWKIGVSTPVSFWKNGESARSAEHRMVNLARSAKGEMVSRCEAPNTEWWIWREAPKEKWWVCQSVRNAQKQFLKQKEIFSDETYGWVDRRIVLNWFESYSWWRFYWSLGITLNPPPFSNFLDFWRGGGLRGLSKIWNLFQKIGACGGLTCSKRMIYMQKSQKNSAPAAGFLWLCKVHKYKFAEYRIRFKSIS